MSRSKTPNPNQRSSYDQNLLVDAPQATRAQLREGYNVDLLDSSRPGPADSTTPAPPVAPPPPMPQAPLMPAATENGSKEPFVESGGVYASKPRTGFWRSRKGIITVVVIIVVVIGAVVGGAVGGTTKKSNGNTGPPTKSSSSPSGTAGVDTSSIDGATTSATPTGSSSSPNQGHIDFDAAR